MISIGASPKVEHGHFYVRAYCGKCGEHVEAYWIRKFDKLVLALCPKEGHDQPCILQEFFICSACNKDIYKEPPGCWIYDDPLCKECCDEI